MTPDELLRASEARLRDAENNLSGAIASLNEHKAQRGGVPNWEVVALAQAQAVVAQAYATLALAKTGITLAAQTIVGEVAAPEPTTDPFKAGEDG